MLYLCPLKRTSNFFFYIHFPSFPSLYSVGLSTSGFLISSFISQCIFCFLSCSHSRSHLSFFFPFASHFPNCPHVLTFSIPWEFLLSSLFSYWSYSVFPPSSCLSSFSTMPFSHNSQFPHLFLHFLPLTKFLQSQLCGSNPFHLYQHI